MKKNELKKKAYSKPKIEKIKIDKNISMVMMSPPGDPLSPPSDPLVPPIIPDGIL